MVLRDRKVAFGLAKLHGSQIVHRDLAARNVLIDAQLTAKLADFGLSRESRGENDDDDMSAYYRIENFNRPLPVRWTAPEVLLTRAYSRAADIYAFGCLLHELFSSAEMPFFALTDEELIELLVTSNSDLADQLITAGMDKPTKQLLRRCTCRDPSDRCSAYCCFAPNVYHSTLHFRAPSPKTTEHLRVMLQYSTWPPLLL